MWRLRWHWARDFLSFLQDNARPQDPSNVSIRTSQTLEQCFHDLPLDVIAFLDKHWKQKPRKRFVQLPIGCVNISPPSKESDAKVPPMMQSTCGYLVYAGTGINISTERNPFITKNQTLRRSYKSVHYVCTAAQVQTPSLNFHAKVLPAWTSNK